MDATQTAGEAGTASALQVLGVSGSPRDAATSILVQAALLGASSMPGIQTSYVSLADKRIAPCNGCGPCVAAGGCLIDDDMQQMYGQLLAADAIILGSPVYYGGPSALAKAFMERVQGLGIREKKLRLRPGGAIAVGASRNGGQESTLTAIHLWFHILDMIPIGITAPVSQWGPTGTAGHDPLSIHDDTFDLRLVDKSVEATQICWMYGRKIATVARILDTGRAASGLDLPDGPYGFDLPADFPSRLSCWVAVKESQSASLPLDERVLPCVAAVRQGRSSEPRGGVMGPSAATRTLISDVHVVTMNPEREEFERGFVTIEGDRITGVGRMDRAPAPDGWQVVRKPGCALLPGFVNAHTHAIHILMRGGLSDDRPLYDWLFNVILPGLAAYDDEAIAVAADFYCREAVRAGVTTFVDNVEFPVDRFGAAADVAIERYLQSGLRVVYARMFYDYAPSHFDELVEAIQAKEPGVRHDPGGFETAETAMAAIDDLIGRHHGRGDGRIQVWPSPGVAILCTPEGLLGAKDLAARHGTGVTLHLAESTHDQMQRGLSSIEYLAGIGFLGPEVLAGHCAQASSADLRILKEFGVKVANNAASNMFLGSGIAPVSEMQSMGITVGLGTDDANCNNSVNMLADMKIAALAQKARYQRPTAITAEKVLEMATIDGAHAVGMAAEIGSVEIGKKADLVLVDLDRPHLYPRYSVPSVLVYQANGSEIDSVMVDGRFLLLDGQLTLSTEGEADFLAHVRRASARVAERAALADYPKRAWRSSRSI